MKKAAHQRLEFYRQLNLIEALEIPYAFRRDDSLESLKTARELALRALTQWKPAVVELYVKADADHLAIKREEPKGLPSKYALALTIRPLIQNIVAFHLTGQELYARQAQQNLNATMQTLADQRWTALHGFLTFMIEDMAHGAAVRA